MSRILAKLEEARRNREGFRSAPPTWQERLGSGIEGPLGYLNEQAGEMRKIPGIGDALGWLGQQALEAPLDAARRAAEGEVNVYADFSSENRLNWQLKKGAADTAMLAADWGGAVGGSLKAVGAGTRAATDAVLSAARRKGALAREWLR